MRHIPDIMLNDGRTIPQLGFGVYLVPPNDTFEVVSEALRAGYRHIDTAEMYGNERGVGEAVRASGLGREEVFVTSKLSNASHRPDDARRAFDATLVELGFDHVDLFLIHWPLPTLYEGDYVATWRTLEEFRRDGRARSIGVSNFEIAHLEQLAAETETVPAVNQIEVHPWLPNDAVRAYGQEHGIVTEAWSPLAAGKALARSGHRRGGGQAQADALTGDAALASAARRCGLPQDDVPAADAREPRGLRLRAAARGRRLAVRARPG